MNTETTRKMEKVKNESNVEEFQKITSDMLETYKKKNSDYGSSFDDLYDEFGMTSVVIRLSDKINRLKSLVKKSEQAEVKDESIEDTLKDLANYAILTLIKRHKDEGQKETL